MKHSILIIGVIVLIVLIVAGGYIGINQLSSNKPETTATPSPQPSSTLTSTETATPSPTNENDFSVQAQIRDNVVDYIARDYPEIALLAANLSWTGGRQETGLLGSEIYLYNTTSGWVMELSYPVVPNPIYTISANYSAGEISVEWGGTCQDGNITQIYCITYGLDYELSPQEQVREDVLAYITTNHAETMPYLWMQSWSGGRITPEGLVGYETYQYTGLGWNITIGNVVYYDVVYDVHVTYSQNGAVLINWSGTSHNGNINETSYTANLPPVQELVRDIVMTYIRANHAASAAPVLPVINWTGGRVDQGMLLGSEIYNYTGSNWTVTIRYPVVLNPVYTVTANYTGYNITLAWEGTWQDGAIVETSYTSSNEANTLYFNQRRILDTVLDYIATNHPEATSLMTDLIWVGQDATPNLLGYPRYQYSSTNWIVDMAHPTIPLQYYQITATYTSPNINLQWSGLFQNGYDYSTDTTYDAKITENSYTYTS